MLANIYLHELDMFVQHRIASFTKGDKRARSKDGRRIGLRIGYLRKKVDTMRAEGHADSPQIVSLLEEIDQLKAERATVPASDAFDPNYRRLRYCRYADDVRHIIWRQIPFTERRGTEEMTPGSTTYLEAKAEGDSSMSLKRSTAEGVYGVAPQDPRDTVRATLPKPQFPAMAAYILCPQRLRTESSREAGKVVADRTFCVRSAAEGPQ